MTDQPTADTRTYPCAACGGQLVFDIASQKMRCPSCGNCTAISAPTTRVRSHPLQPAMQRLVGAEREYGVPSVVGRWEVVCQNCGGTTVFTDSLTATKCPYCATPIQRADVHDAPARLPVDGLLPFRVDQRQARELIETWVAKRWFTPTDFKRYRRIGTFSSLYTAYFSYDAETDTWYEAERGDRIQVRAGKDSYGNVQYKTETRWHRASGKVYNNFADLTVLANDGTALNRTRIKALEPWPVERATAYSPQYIAGHFCRSYDKDAAQALPEAKEKMESTIQQAIRADIGGDVQRINRFRTNWSYLGFKHLLLPIWLLTVAFDGRLFQVYINGVTGKVAGDRPWSAAKILLAIAAVLAVIATAVLLFHYSQDPGSAPGSPTSPATAGIGR